MPHSHWPLPDAAALMQSARLTAKIRHAITSAGGALPFDQFMELALYAPGLGYYMTGSAKWGRAGDFITAPELSPLFGRCLARQSAQLLQIWDGDAEILEFGAGSGRLAQTLLQELQRLGTLPRRYAILEPSPELQARQRATLAAFADTLPIVWLERLPEQLLGIVIANEVLDALPVQRFCFQAGILRERYVTWDGAGFTDCTAAPQTPGLATAVAALEAVGCTFADGYCTELNLRAAAWLATLSERLTAGVLLLLDYGYPRREYYAPERATGTLRCYFRHRVHDNPYQWVGLQDITASVDFSAVTAAATAADLALLGYTTQAHFLFACGLASLLTAGDGCPDLDLIQGVKQLVLPSAMGECFQVIALGRGVTEPLLGFEWRDLRDRL